LELNVKIFSFFGLTEIVTFVCLPALVLASSAGQNTCSKMKQENRNGGRTMEQCLCHYRVAEAVLDDDLKTILFDSWYNGTNNMDAVERLKPRRRIEKQFRTLEKNLRRNCPGSF
jgi:hypothetical protein